MAYEPDKIEVVASLDEARPWLLPPHTGALATVADDGRLQLTPVWFILGDDCVLVSTMREFAKARNLRARPVASLLVIEAPDARGWVEVRASVTLVQARAAELLDEIGERYTGRRPYFGQIVPTELAAAEHPVTCRLEPVAVHVSCTVSAPVVAPGSTAAYSGRAAARRASLRCAGDVRLPADHLDLLDAPLTAALATRLPDGMPELRPVRFARDGKDLVVTTMYRRGGRGPLADPRATLLVVDPADSARWVEIRADMDCEAAALPRLHPRKVHCDAIHR